MNHVRSVAVVTLLLCVLSLGAFAQSDNSTANGVVRDPSSAVVPNAKITLKNQANGLTREVKTNESGNFVIPTIPSGMYTLTVEAAGFKKYESKDNKVDPNLPASFDVALQVGQASEVVEVTATAAALQTESGAVGRIVEGRQLADLQLNGRNPIFLALLKPGVRGTNLGGFSYGMDQAGLSINGSRTQDNLITYDGAVAVRTRSNGTSIGSADLDTTAEVQIMTASFTAEYGRAAGGQIRVVSKSGTSQFHGSAYEYFRNSAIDANTWSRNRNPSTNVVAPLRFNQFGYNTSGPVFVPGKLNKDRSKLFFTWSQEWTKHRREDTTLKVVPTAKMKAGDFSELLVPTAFFGSAQIVKDPANGNAPFAGNIVPKNRQSANGMALLAVFPAANLAVPQGANNWYGVGGHPTDQRKDSIGIDFLPTQKDSIKFRGMLFHYLDVSPFPTGFALAQQTFDRPNQTSSLNWTHSFSPTLINETLITASRDQVFIRMTDTPAFNRTTYGINYPYVYPAGKDRPNKLPAVAIPGFSEYTGTPYPSNSTGPIYSISNNITKILNNHTIKAGFAFERAGQNDYDQINVNGVPGGTNNQNGRFEFSNTRSGGSGVGLGDAALGLFNNYAEIGTRSFTPYRGNMYEWFVQDSWKATDKLKIELGVRHTIVIPYSSLWGNMTVFDPKYYDKSKAVTVDLRTGNPIAGSGDPYNGIVIPGSSWPDSAKGRVPAATDASLQYLFRGGQEPKYYSNIDYGNFQPRIGVAYSLNPKTVIRGGAGKYTTRLGVSDSVFLGGNPPLQPIASIPTGLVDNPGGGSLASFPISVTTQAKVFHMPQSYTWNLTVEREIGFNTVLDVSYVGRRGLFGQREKNINQAALGAVQNNVGINVNALRPYLGYGPIRETFNDANMKYNSLQIGVNRRFSNGLSYGLGYTLSKCMDDGSAQRDIVPNAYDAHNLWGPCTNDTRHVWVLNYIYDLPFFKNSGRALKTIAGGWKISGVTQFQTGTPNTVATGDDFAGVGPGSGSQIWNVTGNPQLGNGEKAFMANAGDPNYWFNGKRDAAGNLLAFAKPGDKTFVSGNFRSLIYNPGIQFWNIGVFKSFAITEKQSFLIRAEGFNFINHPNWGGADYNPTSGTFGKITGKTDDRRNMQISLRYSF
ncbi:TonB-dependent receptor [Paludibaculum fermentans]|uniref:TonB-dependent receptor n=1 Tax=Paludibaculum fermentans TaxID=1473598 RepID=A0A7S7SJH6_PALFE|nr:carboxypeptidase regulatory-like domain-containing protein [Paludibaculum fermentans]QOY86005.1 TonB-dependent receptor [Paludibaculum fermentans]